MFPLKSISPSDSLLLESERITVEVSFVVGCPGAVDGFKDVDGVPTALALSCW